MILLGLNRLKEDVIHLKDIEVRSLPTLFVENFFSSMRGGNTITPTVLDFCRRFPRCTNELLKRVTKNQFNYFTNPKASYYVQPSMKDVLIQFSELAKLPKPSKGSLAPKQITELRQWASINDLAVSSGLHHGQRGLRKADGRRLQNGQFTRIKRDVLR